MDILEYDTMDAKLRAISVAFPDGEESFHYLAVSQTMIPIYIKLIPCT